MFLLVQMLSKIVCTGRCLSNSTHAVCDEKNLESPWLNHYTVSQCSTVGINYVTDISPVWFFLIAFTHLLEVFDMIKLLSLHNCKMLPLKKNFFFSLLQLKIIYFCNQTEKNQSIFFFFHFFLFFPCNTYRTHTFI